MKKIDEKNASFIFGDSWWAVKYDGSDGEDGDIYRKGIGKIPTTKAVDIVATHKGTDVYLIEVKDFRSHRIENKVRVGKELAEEIYLKVRDTIPGIVGAGRTTGDVAWRNCARCCVNPKNPLKVVFHLDCDRKFPSTYEEQKHKGNLKICMEELKAKLIWAGCKVIFTDTRTFKRGIPDIEVRSRPGTGVA